MADVKITLDAIRRVVKDEIHPLREEMEEWKNEILNSNDKVAVELKDLRQEVTMFNGGQRRQDEQLQEHSGRLTRVEAKVGA